MCYAFLPWGPDWCGTKCPGLLFVRGGGGVLSVGRHQAHWCRATGRGGQSQFACVCVVGQFRVVLLVFVGGLFLCGCGVE